MNLIFDIGGTNTRFTLTNGINISEPLVVPTPQKFSDFINVFGDSLKKVSEGDKVDRCVGGLPGVVDQDSETLIYCPNLPNWVGKPIKSELENIAKASVYIENDAALAALGEATLGAGQNFDIVAFLTLSTGVGGARIVNQKIDAKVCGFEPGHQIVDLSSSPPGNPLYLESLISGAGLQKLYNKKAELINDKEVWNKVTKYLAVGLNNTICFWSPAVIILGGAIINSGRIPLDDLRQELLKIYFISSLPEIRFGKLGDSAGLYGALHILKT